MFGKTVENQGLTKLSFSNTFHVILAGTDKVELLCSKLPPDLYRSKVSRESNGNKQGDLMMLFVSRTAEMRLRCCAGRDSSHVSTGMPAEGFEL